MSFVSIQKNIRLKLVEICYKANTGHIGSSLSCIDLLIALFEVKKTNERVILSKGHAAGALYTILNHTNEITDEVLETFYKNGTKLAAHPAANSFENIPFALGSLGHGLPIGCGIAYANKLQKNNDFVYILLSDGETNEGTCWEAAHFASAKKLDNLIVLIDKNNLQAFGFTKDVLGDSADFQKWTSLGFDVIQEDGHAIEKIIQGIHTFSLQKNGKPKLIIANTVKGKGVSFMENKLDWHYLSMNEEQYATAVQSIEENYHA